LVVLAARQSLGEVVGHVSIAGDVLDDELALLYPILHW
jgi:hypothetical protein